MNKSDEYRANAAECERMAQVTHSDNEKRTWLEMAESWHRLADADAPKSASHADLPPGNG
jgi:hypothetical protein